MLRGYDHENEMKKKNSQMRKSGLSDRAVADPTVSQAVSAILKDDYFKFAKEFFFENIPKTSTPRTLALLVAFSVKHCGLQSGSELLHNDLFCRPELASLDSLATYRALVGTLNEEGLFEEVDHFFVRARERGLLLSAATPVKQDMREKEQEEEEEEEHLNVLPPPQQTFLELDLHGLSTPMALSAVRTTLWDIFREGKQQEAGGGGGNFPAITIITGRGRGSKDREPILRPRVMTMLHEDFFPPLDW